MNKTTQDAPAVDAVGARFERVVGRPDPGRSEVVDVQQIVYALERAAHDLQAQADRLHEAGDYGAEFPSEDAQRMREAVAMLQASPTLPHEPPRGLLMSMAIRFDHGLGMPGYYDAAPFRRPGQPSHAQRLEATLRTMRQLYEEVSGHGFYSKAKEAEYAALEDSKTPNASLNGAP